MADKTGNDDDEKLDDDDQALWDFVTSSITPIEQERSIVDEESEDYGRRPTSRSPYKSAASTDRAAGKTSFTSSHRPASRPETDNTAHHPPGLDRRTEQRLKRGKLPIEATIDLHGLSRDNAHDAVVQFIQNSAQSGKRCVLVITGKGSRQSGNDGQMIQKPGVLKQSLPEWLRSPPLKNLVLRYTHARPQHGGEGAFYVLLRRKR